MIWIILAAFVIGGSLGALTMAVVSVNKDESPEEVAARLATLTCPDCGGVVGHGRRQVVGLIR